MRKARSFRRSLFFFAVFMIAGLLEAAYLVNIPQTLHQPNGDVLRCLASGDEYYNWLHDAAGYTIIQDSVTGYYVYAEPAPHGDIRPSAFIVGTIDPAAAGLKPGLRMSADRIERVRRDFLQAQGMNDLSPTPKTGSIANIAVFIRFQGESEFVDPISTYNQKFNDAGAGTSSMYNYFLETSYNALSVQSTFYPTPGVNVVSYQDAQPRGYYQPYNAATNPGGYTGGDSGIDRMNREHTLLLNAVNAVASQIPAGLIVDGDGDGNVDNIVFVVYGSPTGWASLLWPHAWALYSQSAYINGKRVYTYNLQLQSTLGVSVLCHEMFHSIGAPDLYHYTGNGINPVGRWDVMETNLTPPQHMGAFMKWRYGTWIASIPEITTAGTYTLNPLISATGNCYKIRSQSSATEYFVLEYRRRTGAFEISLPGEGLLVYRINSARDGQGNRNGPPDEVYIYRPGGTLTVNGTPNSAAFSSGAGRTAINDGTNPSSFLSTGAPGGLSLLSVGAAGATISFNVAFPVQITGYVRSSSGTGIPNVVISPSTGGTVTSTDSTGKYYVYVDSGWTGTVTPTLAGYTFTPASRSYSNITANQANQDYTAAVLTYSVSGTITAGGTALPNVVMSGLPGNPVANASGQYAGTVSYGWTGTVTPTLAGYAFTPASRSYTSVVTNQADQNYSAAVALVPQISLSRTSLVFGNIFGSVSTSSQSVVVGNSGTGTLIWTAGSNQSWLTANPASGTGTGTMTIGINASGLTVGTYSGTISVTATGASNSPQTISVTLNVISGAGQSPFGSFDTPSEGVAVNSSIAVTGWALDDVEVILVKIYRNPVTGEGFDLVYIGDAIFVEGARPDVEPLYSSYPLNYRGGWGYMMLTNFLPNGGNGTFILSAIATDKDGHQASLGQKTITVNNLTATKPFGAIDTPTQGGTAAGATYYNFGWALTPMPKSIPIDGSTITVYVDGLPIGQPAYNNYRPDIATLFPGYANSNGAVGVYPLNTTGFANGVHTLAWVVSDSVGAADGIGSRFFSVLNTGGGASSTGDEAKTSGTAAYGEKTWAFQPDGFSGGLSSSRQSGRTPSSHEIENLFHDASSPIFVRRGYDFSLPAEPIDPDHNGILKLTISELERVTIHLDPMTADETMKELEVRGSELIRRNVPLRDKLGMNLSLKNKSEGRVVLGNNEDGSLFSAFLIVGPELRPLPIGATFDADRGVLYWQLGPGFFGDYDLVFMDKNQGTKRRLTVRVVPKY